MFMREYIHAGQHKQGPRPDMIRGINKPLPPICLMHIHTTDVRKGLVLAFQKIDLRLRARQPNRIKANMKLLNTKERVLPCQR
jgi:hypothetical protein